MSDQAAVNAEELRKALEVADSAKKGSPVGWWLDREGGVLLAAARSWLSLLGGDEAMVEKVALAIYFAEFQGTSMGVWESIRPENQEYFRITARAVIAAITEGEK